MSVADTQETNLSMAIELGLSKEEFQYTINALKRNPTWAELGIFSSMYSEHCSYKSSKHALRKFPTKGPQVLQGPGENAGIVDVGEGWAVAFKMESHNHPSFIEPYQGAATGVGGILRDVFTMGARPIASMNSLCFGALDHPKTKGLVNGVVKGIGDYGNCVGVPTVGGQTFFHPCYNGNILVNAFTLGLVTHKGIFRGYASGVGNLVVYAGSKTGRDGVHGATMASKEFSTEEEPDRPTVQVGDPFTEKLLIEATLEVMKKNLVVGIQDMGAAGLTSSSFEMAHRANTGLHIDLDKIPTRESGMSAYELLLSESQERMLMVIEPKHADSIREVFHKWDLHSEVIGTVVEGTRVQMTKEGKTVVDIPVDLVVNPPVYDAPASAPRDYTQDWDLPKSSYQNLSLEQKIQALLEGPRFAYPGPLTQQYDSMVGNRTCGEAHEDGSVIRLREITGTDLRISLTVDCNPRVCHLDPKEGGRRAVAESAINLSCRGATPLAITDCLNFGSPQNPNVMWEFEQAVDGICEACETLDTPVISGNVSFYNDTDGNPIYPTPMIGMVGLIKGKTKLPDSCFNKAGNSIALLGDLEGDIGGSEWIYQILREDRGKPGQTDLPTVARMGTLLRSLSQLNVSLHDVSDGGLVSCLMEMWLLKKASITLGVSINIPKGSDRDKVLFGESIPRVVISFESGIESEIKQRCAEHQIGFHSLGTTVEGSEFALSEGSEKVWSCHWNEVFPKWKERWKPLFT